MTGNKFLCFLIISLTGISAVVFSAEEKGGNTVFLSSVLATVNGIPITLYDVVLESANDEQKLAIVYKGKELAREVEKLRGKKAKELVERKLFFQEFKEKEYKIPEQYIEDMLDGLASNMTGGDRKKLEKKALSEGITVKDLRAKAHEKIAVDILVQEFCYRTVNVTPKEVNDYYRNNIAEFSKAPQIELQVLLLKKDGRFKDEFDDTLAKIKNDVEKADKTIFTTLVKLYSEGPDVVKGGSIGWLEESKLRPEFAEALGNLETGGIASSVQTAEGVYFIRIADRMPAKALQFEAVKDEINDKLAKQRRNENYAEYSNKLKDRAVIRYFFME
ncbi:MAG: peptidyl-prolyl cis-trans isomerase [Victivallales bacterium]